jgi:hypothetical protein
MSTQLALKQLNISTETIATTGHLFYRVNVLFEMKDRNTEFGEYISLIHLEFPMKIRTKDLDELTKQVMVKAGDLFNAWLKSTEWHDDATNDAT